MYDLCGREFEMYFFGENHMDNRLGASCMEKTWRFGLFVRGKKICEFGYFFAYCSLDNDEKLKDKVYN